MDESAKFRSGIFYTYALMFLILVMIFRVILVIIFISAINMTIINIISIILFYISISYTLNQFVIFTNKIEIIYFLKLYNRKIIVQIDEVESIKYKHKNSKYSLPTIQVLLRNRKYNMELPSNSFTVNTYKKRKVILHFFAKKCIPIEIDSDFDKDIDILSV